MEIVRILAGLALLAFGRKGLGLFLGAVGFFAGLSIATHLFGDGSSGATITAAIVGGVIGVFLAFFIQKVAVAVAGLLGGGYIGYLVAMHYGWGENGFPWIPVLVAALIGIVLAFFILKWALIILSSVFGAYLVVSGIQVHGLLEMILFFALLGGGILFQARSGKGGGAKE